MSLSLSGSKAATASGDKTPETVSDIAADILVCMSLMDAIFWTSSVRVIRGLGVAFSPDPVVRDSDIARAADTNAQNRSAATSAAATAG
jgi:hypothetical protein